MKASLHPLFVSVLILLFACNEPSTNNEDQLIDTLLIKTSDSTRALSKKAMDDIILSVPSPVEISALIKETGNDYNDMLLNSPANKSIYNTGSKRAIAIGIYGADLGYINVYEKTYAALDYLGSVKDLADEIKVGQFFDFATLKRLAQSKKNVDSLLYITTRSYNTMDAYLRDQNRPNLSVLMACGAWLEGTYLLTQVAGDRSDDKLSQRIGEQKSILNNLLIVLDACKQDKLCQEVLEDFEKIKKEFAGVDISYSYKDPETKEVNGELVVIDKSETNVKITTDQLKNIRTIIEIIRTKYTREI